MNKLDLLIFNLRRVYLGGFLLLFFSLVYYQVFNGDYYQRRANYNYIRVIPQRSIRGAIFDRAGCPLAYDKASFTIAVIPYQIKAKKELIFSRLSKLLDCDTQLIYKRYQRRLQNLFSPVDVVTDINKVTAFKIKEKLGDDVLINIEPQRYYPYPYECAHILGYVKFASAFYENLKQYGYTPFERIGFAGIEQYYDDYLRGSDGGNLIEVNASGKVVGLLGINRATKGKDIYLTIDCRMQKAAYDALGARKGAVIFMESKTGEILALVSSPAFDPNNFVRGKNVENFLKDKNRPLHNRATQSSYPLGSTFKPIMLSAALAEQKIKPSTTFICKGALNLGRAVFRCEHIHGSKDAYGGLAYSCNVYFYNLGLILGRDTISQWARKFGLNSLTKIDLPYEKKGTVPYAGWPGVKRWYSGDTLNLAIGQGYIESSPIEITVAINAFANGGYLLRPRLLKKVEQYDFLTTQDKSVGLSLEILEITKSALRETVNDQGATAYILKSLNLDIAGKTGTAQTRTKPHGWFVGFFPYQEPKYTVCVFLENGGSSYEALKVTREFLLKLKEEKII